MGATQLLTAALCAAGVAGEGFRKPDGFAAVARAEAHVPAVPKGAHVGRGEFLQNVLRTPIGLFRRTF